MGEPQLSVNLLDTLCDGFEHQWIKNESPRIENYIAEAPAPLRSELFEELLAIELEFIQRQQTPPASEYLERFPDHCKAIQRIFEQRCTAQIPYVPAYAGECQPIPSGDSANARLVLSAGSMFGNYEIIRQIGAGGMGVVYQARDSHLGRIVAIKMLRANTTAKGLLDRFNVEVRLASRLDHAAIVPVYEAGAIDGSAFFTMAFVAGKGLEELVREQPLSQQKAAEICLKLADGVQYAHEQNVLHRDLKPQNILMDGDQPRIADFGLARLAVGESDLTAQGQILGTPNYMPPEQAGQHDQVGVTSDVYSLGAILYRIIIGRPPFQASSALETLRQVMKEEAVPLRQLNSAIDKNLETICMKCLAKDPAKRYASALELKDDLQSYLESRPIKARPIGTLERFRMWCRRRPAVAALVASLIIVTVIGFSLVTWKWRDAIAANQLAAANLQQAIDAVDRYFTVVSESKLLGAPGLQPIRRELLENALEYSREFIKRNGEQPDLILQVAKASERVARIHDELGDISTAIEDFKEADRLYVRAKKVFPNSVDVFKKHASCIDSYSETLQHAEDFDGSLQLCHRSLKLWTDIERRFGRQTGQAAAEMILFSRASSAYFRLGRYEDAQLMRLKHDEIIERLIATNPDDHVIQHQRSVSLHNHAVQLHNVGQSKQALTDIKLSDELCRRLKHTSADWTPDNEHFHLQVVQFLAILLKEHHERESAFGLQMEVIERRLKLVDDNPSVPAYRKSLLAAVKYKARDCVPSEDWKGAEFHSKFGRDIAQYLSREFGEDPDVIRSLSDLWSVQGDVDVHFERHDKAIEAMLNAATTFKPLVQKADSQVGDRVSYGNRLRRLGMAYEAAQQYEDAILTYEESREVFRKDMDTPLDSVLEPKIWFADATRKIGHVLMKQGKVPAAIRECQESLRVARLLGHLESADWKSRLHLLWSAMELGNIYLGEQQYNKAESLFREATQARALMSEEIPEMAFGAWEEQSVLCRCLIKMDQLESARSVYDAMLEQMESLKKPFPNDLETLEQRQQQMKDEFSAAISAK